MFSNILFGLYFIVLLILVVYSMHAFVLLYYRKKYQSNIPIIKEKKVYTQKVTIQLPIYNELYVAERLINSVCEIDYPKELLEIQVLDDSTDETKEIVEDLVNKKSIIGFDIRHIRRSSREGFKAGALQNGLNLCKGEFIAIFDADFIPPKDFLKETLKYFTSPDIGMVQTRWGHLNENYSFLTKLQAFALNGHFVIEQSVRNKAGLFINFNGTGGVWRKKAIINSEGWQSDTITEDLDLSYRAQLKGWKFIYLLNKTTPAELPVEINAFKAQQFRWTKGAIETAKKMLPKVWKSDLPLRVKFQSTYHLSNNIVFPIIVLLALLNIPFNLVKQAEIYAPIMNWFFLFFIAFVGTFLFYLFAQKDVYSNWYSRILWFPLFIAGSMGLAINNSKAVMEGLFNKKTDFFRTPKFKVITKEDSFQENKYLHTLKIEPLVIGELLLGFYCLVGACWSIYQMDFGSVPFQLLFAMGFMWVAILSIKHSLIKNNRKNV